MPRLWSDTIAAHRRTVHEVILNATWALVRDRGLLSVTMSQIAQEAGIGRATLYKYFPDVEAILIAGHRRHVTAHLQLLDGLRSGDGEPDERLAAVLEAYALIAHHREGHGTEELAALLHRGEHASDARQQLLDLVRDLLVEVAEVGLVRGDVAPEELAAYCVHALAAAGSLPSEAAVHRLVAVTMAGLRPEAPGRAWSPARSAAGRTGGHGSRHPPVSDPPSS